MELPAEIKDRIHGFIADYEAAHHEIDAFMAELRREIFPDYERGFAKWSDLLSGVAAVHCKRGDVLTANPIPRYCEHRAGHEEFQRIDFKKGKYLVETYSKGEESVYFEYTLEKIRGSWRISLLQRFHTSAHAKARGILGESPIFMDKQDPSLDVGIDFNRVFKQGEIAASVDSADGPCMISLPKPAPRLKLPSGEIFVSDLTPEYINNPKPLGAKISPGKYFVQRSTVVRHRFPGEVLTGAVRVVFSNEVPIAYVPCKWAQESAASDTEPCKIGVQGGAIVFADFRWIRGHSPRDAERIYETCFALNVVGHPGAVQIPSRGKTDLVAVSAGYGDGEFPCYWGINKQGLPVNLVIDFLVYGRYDESGCWQHAFQRR